MADGVTDTGGPWGTPPFCPHCGTASTGTPFCVGCGGTLSPRPGDAPAAPRRETVADRYGTRIVLGIGVCLLALVAASGAYVAQRSLTDSTTPLAAALDSPAPQLAVGGSTTGYLGANETRRFAVEVDEAAWLDARATGGDLVLTLRDSSGNEIGRNDDWRGEVAPRLLAGVEPGRFVVEVSHFSGAPGSFDLSVARLPVLGDGSQIDVDVSGSPVLAVVDISGGPREVSARQIGDSDPTLGVYSLSDGRLIGEDDDGGTGSLDSLLRVGPGRYLLEIDVYSNRYGPVRVSVGDGTGSS